MPVCLVMIVAAMVGLDGNAAPPPAVSAAVAHKPSVAFEVRELRLPSPDWRGKLMPKLQEIARQEGAAVWAVDEPALKELIEICQADARGTIVSAPTMVAPVGQPARMTNEQTIKYVASLKRVADGVPGQASKVAFEPQVSEVHSGVRVNVVSSRLKGNTLFARLVIDDNRLVKMHTSHYSEGILKKVEIESHEGKGLLHDRLHRNVGLERQSFNAQFQIPEVETRHAEGEWLIPSSGALLVSMGPRSQTASLGLQTQFQENLIAITARPIAAGADPAVRRTGIQRNP